MTAKDWFVLVAVAIVVVAALLWWDWTPTQSAVFKIADADCEELAHIHSEGGLDRVEGDAYNRRNRDLGCGLPSWDLDR